MCSHVQQHVLQNVFSSKWVHPFYKLSTVIEVVVREITCVVRVILDLYELSDIVEIFYMYFVYKELDKNLCILYN